MPRTHHLGSSAFLFYLSSYYYYNFSGLRMTILIVYHIPTPIISCNIDNDINGVSSKAAYVFFTWNKQQKLIVTISRCLKAILCTYMCKLYWQQWNFCVLDTYTLHIHTCDVLWEYVVCVSWALCFLKISTCQSFYFFFSEKMKT